MRALRLIILLGLTLFLGLCMGTCLGAVTTNYVGTAAALSSKLGSVESGSWIWVSNGVYTGHFQIGSDSGGRSNLTVKAINQYGARLVYDASSEPVVWIPTSGNTLSGFEITGSDSDSGVYVTGHTNTVERCWIHHCGTNSGTGVDGIEAHDLYNFVAQFNLVEYCGKPGGVQGHGIYMSGTNCTMRANVLRYNSNGGGQFYRGADNNPSEGSLNGRIYLNISYGNGGSAFFIGSHYGRTFAFFSNTASSTNGHAVLYINDSMGQNATVLATNNALWDGNGASAIVGSGTNGTWFAGYNNRTNQDVVFAMGGLFWLTGNSGLRGTATPTTLDTDFWGGPGYTTTDIGAVQYNPVLEIMGASEAMPDPNTLPAAAGIGTINAGTAILQ